jgi:hypothetical protein
MSREEILEEFVDPFVEGQEYRFNIVSIGDAVPTTNSSYREWKFETFIDSETHDIRVNMFPFQVIPIGEALGVPKVTGKMKIDYDKIEGQSILATVFYEKYKNKKGEDRRAARLKDYRRAETDETIPF